MGPMPGTGRDGSSPNLMAGMQMPGMAAHAPMGAPSQPPPYGMPPGPHGPMAGASYPPGPHGHAHGHPAPPRKSPILWIVIGVLLVAAATGAVLALTL